jgi:uncharacterized OB-fold protein
VSPADRPSPAVEHPRPAPGTEHWPFWEACRRHELAFERCGDCGRFRHHPRPRCPFCQSAAREWATVDGRGVVASWTVIHPPVLPAFEAVAPYNAVVVHLPGPDVHLVSNVVDCPNEELAVGMAVEVTFVDVDDELTLPQFRAVR